MRKQADMKAITTHRQRLTRASGPRVWLAGVCALAWMATAHAQNLAIVDGTAIPNAQAEVLLQEQLARGVVDSAELRSALREGLIQQTLMAHQAAKLGLDTNPVVQAQVALAQKNVLALAWQQSVLAGLRIEDADVKAEYERQLRALGDTDYLLRHLLVREEPTARLLIEKINAGSKLADLAREFSIDMNTRERGGLTDWTNGASLLSGLAQAVKRMTKGQLAPQPIQTDAGWHVLYLDDTRPSKPATLDEVKPQLAQMLARRKLDDQIKALREKAKVQ